MTCIVIAAGASLRLGHPKQLVLYEGEPLVRRAARIAREVAPTVVVAPPAGDLTSSILEATRDLDVRVLPNGDAHEGMGASIRCGVVACEGDVLITLCDQPLVTSEHLRMLVNARAPIAASGYSGVSGVPAFFAAQFRDELLGLRGDVGARRIIEAHREVVVTVPFEDAAVDIDT